MLTKGVYTTECPTCHRSILMHVLSDNSISQKKCVACETEFERLDKGEDFNTFVVVPKAKKLGIFGGKEDEETQKTEEKKTDEKKPFDASQFSKKTGKRILKW